MHILNALQCSFSILKEDYFVVIYYYLKLSLLISSPSFQWRPYPLPIVYCEHLSCLSLTDYLWSSSTSHLNSSLTHSFCYSTCSHFLYYDYATFPFIMICSSSCDLLLPSIVMMIAFGLCLLFDLCSDSLLCLSCSMTSIKPTSCLFYYQSILLVSFVLFIYQTFPSDPIVTSFTF